jgi:L-threonylcarbamoyladenylate synthase
LTLLDRTGAVSALRDGRIVLMDTDTLPGLHVRAADAVAADRLSRLKQAAEGRPFLLLVADVDSALSIGRPAERRQEARLRELWPGALTALLVPQPGLPDHWIRGTSSVGVRVPGSAPLREFLAEFGEPIFSTSANLSGTEPAATLEEAARVFPGLDRIRIGAEAAGISSTIVDFTVDPPRLVRAGTVAFDPDSGRPDPA